MSERIRLGMDFGTSNSSVGSFEDDRLEIYKTKGNSTTQPSSIFIRADGFHSTGFDALDDFTSQEAKSDTYHFVPSIKPGLPITYYEGIGLKSKTRNIEGNHPVRFFGVEELASFVISNLKQKAQEQSGKQSDEVVIGRPVFFSEDKNEDKLAQERLEEAARMAGFKSIRFILEPIAAALYYERSRPHTKAKNVFIFDFGGGTLDTCILQLDPTQKITDDNLRNKVSSSYGITLGGTDLDKDIFSRRYLPYFGQKVVWGEKKLPMPSHIFNNLPEWHLIEQLAKNEITSFLRQITHNCSDPDAIKRLSTLINDQQVFSVLQSIERGKIGLSTSTQSRVKYSYKEVEIDNPISRREYESMISSRKEEIKKCMDECLKRARLKPHQIDAVLKVGGSSNNSFVDSLLMDKFGAKIESDDVFTSVVAGLSIAANELFD